MSLEQLLLAGYVIVRPANFPPDRVLPPRILTISDCIMDDLPRPEFWDWYQDEAEARAAQTSHPDTQVITVALHEKDALDLINEEGGPEQPYFELLRQRLEPKGTLLGYEVVGAEANLDFHSWHCYDYAEEVHTQLGIQVGDQGLLETYSEATSVLEWMLARPTEEAPAPVLWIVVGLVAAAN